MAETTRFFVANLPVDCTDLELKSIFQKHGKVKLLEIKKKNTLDPENVNMIAFVTMEINAYDGQHILNGVNTVKLRGCKLQVSVARESFLERLKRERAAENSQNGSQVEEQTEFHTTSKLLSEQPQNKRKQFITDDDFNFDEQVDDVLLTKKRASNSLLPDGKIVIEKFDAAPLHIIEKVNKSKHSKQNHLNPKSSSADQKRRESQLQKSQQYEQKKFAIQNALINLNEQQGRKIKFNDNDDYSVPAKTKLQLFNNDENDDNADEETIHNSNNPLELKAEHFGKKGAKLLAMQSRQQVADARFKIDSKFVDDDDDDGGEEYEESKEENAEKLNERDWQMNILQQVVKGTNAVPAPNKKQGNKKKMQRFDPSKEEHAKFLRPPTTTNDDVIAAESKKQKPQKKKQTTNEPKDAVEVSKDIFYCVNEKLSETLGSTAASGSSAGFSLLKMFGAQGEEHLVSREQQLKELANEKIIVNRLNTNDLNPFKYDSSSESETEEKTNKTKQQKKHGKKDKENPTLLETFFITKNDARLKEGATFFVYSKPIEDSNENYDGVRKRLRTLIHTKIVKTKKRMKMSGKLTARKTRNPFTVKKLKCVKL